MSDDKLVYLEKRQMQDDYTLGEPWYSYDNGVTWTRRGPFERKDEGHLTVTGIDRDRGIIEVS